MRTRPRQHYDGNLINGPLPAEFGNANLVWDAENRLVEVTPASGPGIQYQYDDLGRRISKHIGSGAIEFYLYDGWNLIAEYTGGSLSKSYTWGMDLSGPLQGAGGVGGLLAVDETSATYNPTYDGNGNVSEYLNASGGIEAHYEYDAFGNTTTSVGAKSGDFRHRFSTKPLDAETGLYYYGYRYYNPVTGRWPSRDPIAERGGVNLYGFVGNEAVNWCDYLGLLDKDDKCVIEIDISHGRGWGNFDIEEWREAEDQEAHNNFKDIPKSCRLGVVSCGDSMDQANAYLQNMGLGIWGMPKINGDWVGPGDAPGMDTNGKHPNGEECWNAFLKEAWEAAWKEARILCNSKEACCEEATVRVVCTDNEPKIIIGQKILDAEYDKGKKRSHVMSYKKIVFCVLWQLVFSTFSESEPLRFYYLDSEVLEERASNFISGRYDDFAVRYPLGHNGDEQRKEDELVREYWRDLEPQDFVEDFKKMVNKEALYPLYMMTYSLEKRECLELLLDDEVSLLSTNKYKNALVGYFFRRMLHKDFFFDDDGLVDVDFCNRILRFTGILRSKGFDDRGKKHLMAIDSEIIEWSFFSVCSGGQKGKRKVKESVDSE